MKTEKRLLGRGGRKGRREPAEGGSGIKGGKAEKKREKRIGCRRARLSPSHPPAHAAETETIVGRCMGVPHVDRRHSKGEGGSGLDGEDGSSGGTVRNGGEELVGREHVVDDGREMDDLGRSAARLEQLGQDRSRTWVERRREASASTVSAPHETRPAVARLTLEGEEHVRLHADEVGLGEHGQKVHAASRQRKNGQSVITRRRC